MSPHPDDFREMPCSKCGGDGGWDVPHDIDRRHGGTIDHWVECRDCGGTGTQEVEFEPVTEEEIMEEA